jgi:transposase
VIDYPGKKNSIKRRCHMHYIGIDHHKQYSHITILDERGEVIKTDRVGNTHKEVEVFLHGLDGKIEGVIEAGYSHYTMVDLKESVGVRMKIAHPKQIKAIAKARIKTDKRDSKILAHLLRSYKR